jgi:hypothetical protein
MLAGRGAVRGRQAEALDAEDSAAAPCKPSTRPRRSRLQRMCAAASTQATSGLVAPAATSRTCTSHGSGGLTSGAITTTSRCPQEQRAAGAERARWARARVQPLASRRPDPVDSGAVDGNTVRRLLGASGKRAKCVDGGKDVAHMVSSRGTHGQPAHPFVPGQSEQALVELGGAEALCGDAEVTGGAPRRETKLVADCVERSRAACTMRLLNGAAPVCYGWPTAFVVHRRC